jgi:hypothetical protein
LRGLVLAWAVGLGIMAWREAQQYHRPVVPGRVLGASAVYALLALIAEYEPATRAAVLAAWGFDIAVLFQAGPAALVSTKGFTTNSQSPLASSQSAGAGAAAGAVTGAAAGARQGRQ